jgi:hypothetical protein
MIKRTKRSRRYRGGGNLPKKFFGGATFAGAGADNESKQNTNAANTIGGAATVYGDSVDTNQFSSYGGAAGAKTNAATSTISSINPAIGALYAIGSAGGKAIEKGNEDKKGAQLAVDAINPSHGFITAMETGEFQDALPIGGALMRAKRAKTAMNKFKREQAAESLDVETRRSNSILESFPSDGNDNIGYAHGGNYKTDSNQIPQPTDDSQVEMLSEDAAVFKGKTHKDGGIDLDTNQDGAPEIEIENDEVVSGSNILSNRLKPSKEFNSYLEGNKMKASKKDTYAKISERLEKKIGKFEEMSNSSNPVERKTAEIMLARFESITEALFQDQEASKEKKAKGGKYPDGGKVPSKTQEYLDSLGLPQQQEVYDKYLTIKNPITGEDQKYGEFRENFLNTDRVKAKQLTDSLNLSPEEYVKKAFDRSKNSFFADNATEIAIPFEERDTLFNANIARTKKLDRTGISVEQALIKNNRKGNPNAHTTNPTYPNGGEIDPDKLTDEEFEAYYNTNFFDQGYSLEDRNVRTPFLNAEEVKVNNSNKPVPVQETRTNFKYELPFEERYLETPNRLEGIKLDDYKNSEIIPPSSVKIVDYNSATNKHPDKASSIGDFFDKNSGNILNAVNFLSNDRQIRKLETNVTPETIGGASLRYTDRRDIGLNSNDRSFRNAVKGIDDSTAQNRSTSRAALFSQKLNADNQVNLGENVRRDQVLREFDNRVLRTDAINSDILNRNKEANLTRSNDKIALHQQNSDALMKGIIGNMTQKDLMELDGAKALLIAAKDGDRGTVDRLLEKYPELRELLRLKEKDA